jgi:hypothetical protein
MGFIVNDTVTLSNGKIVTNPYVSFTGMHVSIIPGNKSQFGARVDPPPPQWVVTGTGYVIQAKKGDVEILDQPMFDFEITADDLNTPLFQLCYNSIKSKYNNTEDC